MAFIVIYVEIDSNNEVQIKESFLNFFPLHGKNADEITKSNADENKMQTKTCLSHVETTHLTLQEFTQWDRRKFLKHFLLL